MNKYFKATYHLSQKNEERLITPSWVFDLLKLKKANCSLGVKAKVMKYFKLSKRRFVGVIGPSGSGKSSFIYYGILPILYGGFLTDTSLDWEVVVTRPGAGPIENLAKSIVSKDSEYLAADDEEKKIKKTIIITTLLKSSSLGLAKAVLQSRRSTDKNYLILVDQFEELFRFKDSDDTTAVNLDLSFC